MPNFFSAFTTDVFRPLATIFIPGAIGASTWFVALLWQFPALKGLLARNRTESGFALVFGTIFVGMVLEDFGSRWESLLDRWADRRTKNLHTKNWLTYLQTAFKEDPIGRRYARTLVLRLKFELGVAFATVSAGLGILWLSALGLRSSIVITSEFVCIAFTVWGLIEAKETHKVLSKTRALLLGEIRIIK
jgi:hypothetical protein